MAEEPKKSKIAEREEEILKFWKENKIFEKSLVKESPKGEFVFYDGPPFATGEPHYGHLLAGTIKDAIPRYKTMLGYHVLRVWGWDCHGLPIENLIEKELNLGNKKEIEKYGIDKFNKAARESVLRYENVWKNFVPRSGRWVDMDNAYKTMDSAYTESVWWSFKTLFDKGLVYEGFKVMPYCPHDGTTLSNFEVSQNYKDISDISVYVKFKMIDAERNGYPANTYFLAWTTTPWTLPGNVALAVGKEIKYGVFEKDNNFFIVASELGEKLGFSDPKMEIGGVALRGISYEPIFNYYNNDKLQNKENAWKVYAGDFVNTEDGTGIVHIAPAFGEDDMNLSKKYNLPFIQHVDLEGKIKPEAVDFVGLIVKPKTDDEKEKVATDIAVIKYLQESGNYFDKKKITHSYPHCWRCDTPLLNYATSSWFVKVTDLKEKMIGLNEKTKWIPPEIGENRFGKWLLGAKDWAVSRSRFWGAPLPVWRDEEGSVHVFGSFDKIKEKIPQSGNKYFAMRHGESEKNARDIMNHELENVFHLTENGKQMVHDIASYLKDKKIDRIISSPFDRCKETAEIMREELGLPADSISIDDRLWELKKGHDFEGKTLDEYHRFFRNTAERFNTAPPGGETLLELNKRAGDFLYDIENKYKNKNILIVSHMAVLAAITMVAEGLSLEEDKVLKEESVLNPGLAEIISFDFVPLPHNENYELDLHRPYIDDIELVDEKKGKLTRVKEVFDTWYDSGSMPYASVHYPFQNKEIFEGKDSPLFPADFIAEGLDQTRGWFYTLLVLGAGVFGKSPYENVIVNGIVLAEDGQKMSKRLKNYPDPNFILDKYGADAMRYYLLSSPAMRAEDLAFSEKSLDELQKKLLARLENVLSFYKLYSTEEIPSEQKESKNVLDKWLLARLNELGEQITKHLDAYELDRASRPILDFIDDFSTWYLRRSRDRFKGEDIEGRNAALQTTHYVLMTLAKYMAPFTPFFAEYIYRELGGEDGCESVHLCAWPFDFAQGKSEAGNINKEILENMEEVRKIVSLALEKRNEAGIKIRQPLQKLKIKSEIKLGEEYLGLIKDELNVKEVEISNDLDSEVELDTNITPELQEEGNVRDFIRTVQEFRKNANLTPDQKITLLVETDSAGQSFIESNKAEISKPTNIYDFDFSSNDGTELKIGEIRLKIRIK